MRKWFLSALLLLVFSGSAYSEGARQKNNSKFFRLPKSRILAKDEPQNKEVKKYKKEIIDSWEPYWVPMGQIEESQFSFFQFNLGLNFLYFSGLSANYGPIPSPFFQNTGSVNMEGSLGYNRTPIYEYLIGYKYNCFLRAAISYQHESGVVIASKSIKSNSNIPVNDIVDNYFRSNLALDAFMLKVFFDFPWPMIWKKIGITPYIGGGAGAGWQSWTDVWFASIGSNQMFSKTQLFLKSKYAVNFMWGAEAGFKIQPATPNRHFTLLAGVKFNDWGQTGNLGALKDQGPLKAGFFKPFKIKMLYSFAPFLSLQWDIEGSKFVKADFKLDNKFINTWKPFILSTNFLQSLQYTFVQFNGGIGFLYFAGIRGNLSLKPTNGNQGYGAFPGKYSMSYNRTPIVEYLFGYKLSPWFKVAISKQSQDNVFVETRYKSNVNASIPSQAKFQGCLNLLSAAAKVYLQPPFSLIFKNLAWSIYISGGAGPSWQTWTRMGLDIESNIAPNAQKTGSLIPIRPKVIPNIFFLADAGIKVKNATPQENFLVALGCRYNYWGSCRNLGKITQSYPDYRQGFSQPLSIKTLYSFVPYIGVQWNFEEHYFNRVQKQFCIKGRDVQSKFPYFTSYQNLEFNKLFFAQVNTGVGFLYFERLRSNLAGSPYPSFYDQAGSNPFTDKPCYNRTPLFEYLIGTKIFTFLNLALSYQYQGGVEVSTPILIPNDPVNQNYVAKGNRFVANFRVDSVMAKFYFNVPFSVIWFGLANTPYIAPGLGVGWQTWSRINVQRIANNLALQIDQQITQPINQKISPNFVWSVDIGIRSCSAYPNGSFSSTMGIKFVDWGQALSMGRPQDQRGGQSALIHPFKIRMVYSFAPYFGVQWDF